MSNKSNPTVATMGIDIGKNSFHVVGLDRRGAIVLRQKWSRPSNRRVRSYPNSGCARIRPGTPASGQKLTHASEQALYTDRNEFI